MGAEREGGALETSAEFIHSSFILQICSELLAPNIVFSSQGWEGCNSATSSSDMGLCSGVHGLWQRPAVTSQTNHTDLVMQKFMRAHTYTVGSSQPRKEGTSDTGYNTDVP